MIKQKGIKLQNFVHTFSEINPIEPHNFHNVSIGFFFGYELQKKTVIFLTYKLKKFLLNDYHSQNFTIVRKIVLIYLILQSSNRSKFFNN